MKMENKINIRDLRVGNWISVHHPTMPPENIQISADWIRSIERINNGLIKEDSPLFRIVEPIPLTEEILIQNGFPEDEWHGSFPEDKGGLLYIVLSYSLSQGNPEIFSLGEELQLPFIFFVI
jgi:hypothetical protein